MIIIWIGFLLQIYSITKNEPNKSRCKRLQQAFQKVAKEEFPVLLPFKTAPATYCNLVYFAKRGCVLYFYVSESPMKSKGEKNKKNHNH